MDNFQQWRHCVSRNNMKTTVENAALLLFIIWWLAVISSLSLTWWLCVSQLVLYYQYGCTQQWLKLPAGTSESTGSNWCEPYPGLQVSKQQNVSSPLTRNNPLLLKPPWPIDSVLGLRPPGLEFLIMCLEGSVNSFLSPSSGGSPDPA